MPIEKLKRFLDEKGVKYVTISHSPAYTAQGIAASAHVPGKELVKTVMVKLDGALAMAVTSAPHRINLDLLKTASGAASVELAKEQEFAERFPTCDVGAMPPFGNLYEMAVYVDETLSADEEIAFNAGAHTELIRMSYNDFEGSSSRALRS
jgi:Ala-tRNA(Pro) deacylase